MIDTSSTHLQQWKIYKEGYLTEHVETAKGKEYTITYEVVSGGTARQL